MNLQFVWRRKGGRIVYEWGISEFRATRILWGSGTPRMWMRLDYLFIAGNRIRRSRVDDTVSEWANKNSAENICRHVESETRSQTNIETCANAGMGEGNGKERTLRRRVRQWKANVLVSWTLKVFGGAFTTVSASAHSTRSACCWWPAW